MFKNAGIIFAAAIFIAGCSTSKPPEKVIEPVESKNVSPELNWTNPQAQKTFTSVPKNPSPMKTNSQMAAPVTTWTSLAQWAAEHKLKAPHRLKDLSETAFVIDSPNGAMVLGIGSREVTWNGINLNLGFAPQLIDNEIFLHGADLQKHLEPLLCEPLLALPQTKRVIVIDPGHGGHNSGTVSVLDGRMEKEFTLDTALRLKPLLETNGWTVFLTRTNDVDFVNSNRVTFADAHHADLFISLHFNATGDRSQNTSGIETYSFTPFGMPSTLTRNYADPWYANFPANDFDAQNLQLAMQLHNALIRATGL
ncbi:MAG TPA: N-acetylmuramoyl-L-alanine amidase, partial [Candidatus Baltobacteraceae bacterium]|nr:N-acetylmuramoyl-L-alanine amidase [Candidatus Baltobacteraceae bacterium]